MKPPKIFKIIGENHHLQAFIPDMEKLGYRIVNPCETTSERINSIRLNVNSFDNNSQFYNEIWLNIEGKFQDHSYNSPELKDEPVEILNLPRDWSRALTFLEVQLEIWKEFEKQRNLPKIKDNTYYKVEDVSGFWMLGRTEFAIPCSRESSITDHDIKLRCGAKSISQTRDYLEDSSWCYYYKNIDTGKIERNFREATKEEIKYFEYCERLGKKESKERYDEIMSFKIGDYVTIIKENNLDLVDKYEDNNAPEVYTKRVTGKIWSTDNSDLTLSRKWISLTLKDGSNNAGICPSLVRKATTAEINAFNCGINNFKEGEWVYFETNRDFSSKGIFKYKEENEEYYYATEYAQITDNELYYKQSNLAINFARKDYVTCRKATSDEIFYYLQKVAEQKGFKKGVKFNGLRFSKRTSTFISYSINETDYQKYIIDKDQINVYVGSLYDKIYEKGKWATLVNETCFKFGDEEVTINREEITLGSHTTSLAQVKNLCETLFNLPTINDYKVNFNPDSPIYIGCKKGTIQQLQEIYNFIC